MQEHLAHYDLLNQINFNIEYMYNLLPFKNIFIDIYILV